MRSTSAAGSASRATSWAAAAPLLCAVHCIATPVLVLVVPGASLHGPLETAFKAGAALLAALFLASGVRAHGRFAVALPVALGLALWLAVPALGVGGWGEMALGALGGVLQAAGLAWSAALRHRAVCHTCACPAHPH